jgi:aminopeptidase N
MQIYKKIIFLFFLYIPFNVTAQFAHPDCFKEKFTTNKKYNLYYNKQLNKYNLHFVKLDLNISDASTYISGNATLQARAVIKLDTLILDFSNHMTIDSMFINDSKINANHIDNEIQYVFDTPINDQGNFKIQIYYHGTPSTNGGGVTHDYDSEWNKNVTWTLSESFHAYEWWPCKQVLSDKIDSTHIFLTCDNDCKAGSNGLLTNVVDLPNSKTRYEWKSNYPINYYLLSYAVSEYQDYSIYANPSGSSPILVQNYIYNTTGCLTNYKNDIDHTVDFIELYSEKFGLYPFANEKYGHCLTTLRGGMEHQTMTTLGSFGYTLVAHELGHMWFGDYVTCASWQDIWINEGFASYTEYVALENLTPKSNAIEWMNDAHNRVLNQPEGSVYIPFEDANNENRIFNYSLSYKKGAAIIHTLRHEINNDDLFFSSIRDYLALYGNSVATGDNFKTLMEEKTGVNLYPFFYQWYFGKGFPQFNVDYKQVNDTLTLNVNQSSSSSETPLFQLYVDYRLYFSDGDTTLRLYQSQNNQTFKIPITKTITKLSVDPDNWIVNSAGTVKKITNPEETNPEETNKLFTFYPNPTVNEMILVFNSEINNKEKTIEILDLNGRILFSFGTHDNSLPLSFTALSNGFYILRVSTSSKSYSKRFLKQ